jgi:hypothetical protein
MLGKFWIVQNLALLGPYLAPFAPNGPNQAFLASIFETAHQIFILFSQKLDFNV